jgi:hypothetical protein
LNFLDFVFDKFIEDDTWASVNLTFLDLLGLLGDYSRDSSVILELLEIVMLL